MKTKYNPTFIVFGFLFFVGIVSVKPIPLVSLTIFVLGLLFFFYGIKLRHLAKKGIEDTKK